MVTKKGFTLIEIIIALLILGILAALAIPNYIKMIDQGIGTSIQYDLITLARAQKAYYLNNGRYCTNDTTHCGISTANINAALHLNLTTDNGELFCASPVPSCYFWIINDTYGDEIYSVDVGSPIKLTGQQRTTDNQSQPPPSGRNPFCQMRDPFCPP